MESDRTLHWVADSMAHTERAQHLGTIRGNGYGEANITCKSGLLEDLHDQSASLL
jgi:hypothetical protein